MVNLAPCAQEGVGWGEAVQGEVPGAELGSSKWLFLSLLTFFKRKHAMEGEADCFCGLMFSR